MLNLLVKTAARRWALGIVVSVLLSSAAWFGWQRYQESLRDQGRDEAFQVCNEEIYKANIVVLEEQLEREKDRVRRLTELNSALRAENEAAITRREDAERKVAQLLRDRETQAKRDETYREWSATPLPDGVAARLQRLSESGTAGEDRN